MSAKVTIGLPVYNGENYLDSALRSVRDQTFANFELIISDNASADRTEAICRRHAAEDTRIEYLRRAQNLGAAENFNRLVDRADGRYFKWWAHDDLCAPTFIERCVEVLDRESSTVLAYPKTQDIDEDGGVIKKYPTQVDLSSKHPDARFFEIMNVVPKYHSCFEIFGLIRMDVLRSIRLFEDHAQTDRIVLARLLLRGRFHEIDDYLFYRRMHDDRSVRHTPSHITPKNILSRLVGPGPLPPAEWFAPERKGEIAFPYWKLFRKYVDVIREAPIPRNRKRQCYLYLTTWLTKNSPRLAKDVVLAGEHAFTKYVLTR